MSRTLNASRAAIGLTLSNVIVMAINALVGILIARSLPAAQYGQVAYFMSIFLMATLISGFGLTSQAMRDIAEFKALDNVHALHRSFYTLMAIRIATGLVLIALMGLYSLYAGSIIPVTVGICAALSMLSDFLSGVLRGVDRIGALILVLWCQPAVYLILLSIEHVGSAEQVISAFGASFGVSALLGILLLWGSKIGLPRKESFSRAYARASSGLAFQLYCISLLQTAYGSAGALFLGGAGFYHATGLISVGLTIARILPLILGPALGSIFYPQMCAYLAARSNSAAQNSFEVFYKTSLLVAVGGAALLMIFPDTAIYTLYTAKYAQAIPALRVLAPASLIMVIDLLFTWTLIAHSAARKAIVVLAIRLSIVAVGALLAILLGEQAAPGTLAIAYGVSASVGLVLQGMAIRQVAGYSLRLLEAAILIALAVCMATLCRVALPDLHIGTISYLGNAFIAVVLYAGIALIVFYWAWLRSAISHMLPSSPSRLGQ